MKKTLCLFAIALLAISFNSCSKDDNGDEWIVDDTPIQFEDPNFLKALLQGRDVDGRPINVDTNNDGQISRKEAAQVKSLGVYNCSIRNMDEIKYFTALEYLACGDNYITSLDVSNNKALKELYCTYNRNLTSLNAKNCTALVKLRCDQFGELSRGNMTSLDISGCTALEELECQFNELTSLDVSTNTALKGLWCFENQLTSINVSNCIALEELSCSNNKLTSLDVSKNTALKVLSISHNQLTSIDLSKNTALKELFYYDGDITELDLSKNKQLDKLYISSESLTLLYLYKYHNFTGEEIDQIKRNCPNALIYYVE